MGADELDLESLQADLEQLTADMNQVASLFVPPTGEVTETDDLQVVTATVSPGLVVKAITVESRWDQKVTPEELVWRLNATLGRAMVRSMGFDPELVPPDVVLDEEVAPAPVTDADRAEAGRTLQAAEERMAAEAFRVRRDPYEAGQRVEGLLARIDGQLRAAEAAERAAAEQEEPEEPERLYSANRMVSAVAMEGTVTEIEINLGWLRGKSGAVVSQCLAEVVEQVPQSEVGALFRFFGE